ncbi:Predicted protein [Taphrina deformans PYCC 5710]|uniref:Signal peptidase complex subunit 2 n=1 Tax=Taphrina deformans (strain PYCC 5710 / ATCC 11124 / CBS 356.35 / IMI 108563 / JCM 9778 / NBRC 8474) TaxID=1097556 RepID=R4XBE8_TAPDE|nr:Predicted protein [Taphrina deformans PYCC 5710]|eukprot:CCG81691.1 Predicted protein [Taphrina deformans PYCC 5710]
MVNIFSLTELKNASDDTIPATLRKMGYTQSHTLMDVRLLLGYIGVVAAALAGGYDYKVGFEKAKGYTLIGVLTYFLFYGGMNAWQYFVERGTVYVGTKGASRVVIRTRTDSASPVYRVEVTTAPGSGKGHVVRKHELFTKWFDLDGNLVAEPLQTWIGLLIQEAEGSVSKKKK